MMSFRVPAVAAAAMIVLALPASAQPGGRQGGANLEAMMSQMDLDGDGAISQSEMDAAQSQRFATLDADGDGLASEVEFLDAAKSRGGGRMANRMSQRFAQMDSDGDGFVTEAEFADAGRTRLERLDTDGDGLITAEEMRETARLFLEQRSGTVGGRR